MPIRTGNTFFDTTGTVPIRTGSTFFDTTGTVSFCQPRGGVSHGGPWYGGPPPAYVPVSPPKPSPSLCLFCTPVPTGGASGGSGRPHPGEGKQRQSVKPQKTSLLNCRYVQRPQSEFENHWFGQRDIWAMWPLMGLKNFWKGIFFLLFFGGYFFLVMVYGGQQSFFSGCRPLFSSRNFDFLTSWIC